MKWTKQMCSALFIGAASLGLCATAYGARVDLRVLVVAVGEPWEDPGREMAEQLLDNIGVSYEVLDSSRDELTTDFLTDGDRGRFNGVILTQSETYLPGTDGLTGFDGDEFAILHQYERDFGVREAVLSGFPATNWSLNLDYGMDAISWGVDIDGRWQAPAGGTTIFEYVNTDNLLPTEGFAFVASPRNDIWSPVVEPLLVDDQNPSHALISKITYADGREVLLSTLNTATWFYHSEVLAYEFLNFATSGLFLGVRRVYLSLHNDDLFSFSEVWNPATDSNFPKELHTFRLSGAEIPVIAASQNAMREDFPLAGDLVIELTFNGGMVEDEDDLVSLGAPYWKEFAFINHTFDHLDMGRICDKKGVCNPTEYKTAYNDIYNNRSVWGRLGFPGYDHTLTHIVTGGHSGLSDSNGTANNLSDDIPFPEGLNLAFAEAMYDLGVEVVASDISRPNQGTIQRIPGFENIAILPRYPTSLFYNVTTPEELVSEYNYLYYYRYRDEGVDPCTIPRLAICAPRSYTEILQSEVDVTLRHMLSNQLFPHFFHQANLHIYDDDTSSLQFDWIYAVLSVYSEHMTLPITSLRYPELGDLAWLKIHYREAEPSGWLDTESGVVTLIAKEAAQIEVTGLLSGEIHGGQRQARVSVDVTPQRYTYDPALDL